MNWIFRKNTPILEIFSLTQYNQQLWLHVYLLLQFMQTTGLEVIVKTVEIEKWKTIFGALNKNSAVLNSHFA